MRSDEVPARLIDHVRKLGPLYEEFTVVVLAFKHKDRWILMHGAIVLTTEESLKAPSAPFPTEHFLLSHEERNIETLEEFVADIQNSRKLLIDGQEVIIDFGKEATWSFLPLERHSDEHRWLSYPGLSVVGKLMCATLSETLEGAEGVPDSILSEFGRFRYTGLYDFSAAVFGSPISIGNRASISFIAPTWSSIVKANLTQGILKVTFRTPRQIHESVSIYAAVRDSREIAIELRLAIEDFNCDYTDKTKRNVECIGTYEVLNREIFDENLEYVLDVSLVHTSGIALARYRDLIPTSTDKSDNTNLVSRIHFETAVHEAAKCQPDKAGEPFPHVGAVIVKNGLEIARAHRGEIGRGDHAEFIVLERRSRDNADVEGADLITTLEPCTTRSHDKHPCVSWIKSRRIRKVWIGTLDYNPSIAGKGELFLLKEGILTGRFPDDLTREIREMNREFFTSIELKQPTIDSAELKEQRLLIIDMIRDRIRVQYDPSFAELLKKILDRAISLEISSPNQWCILGSLLRDANEIGLSWLAYSISNRIDASFQEAWIERAHVEYEMNKEQIGWPIFEPILPEDPTLNHIRSNSWFQLAESAFNDSIMQLKYITRAMQLGKRDDAIWQLTASTIERIETDFESLPSTEKAFLLRFLREISIIWLLNVEDKEKYVRLVETLNLLES